MQSNQQISSGFNHFEIIQQLTHSILIKVPCLSQDPERFQLLEVLLCKRDAVESTLAQPGNVSLAIHFDPVRLPLDNLLALLELLLTNIGSQASHTLRRMKSTIVEGATVEENYNFIIKGMSCECCALSLEMGLREDSRISQAKVEFATSGAQLKGCLSKQELSELIQQLGFGIEKFAI